MATKRMNVQGFSMTSPKSFQDVVSRLEAAVGHPDRRLFRRDVTSGVRPMIEKCPLAKAAEGYAHKISGQTEFRVILTTGPPELGALGIAGFTRCS